MLESGCTLLLLRPSSQVTGVRGRAANGRSPPALRALAKSACAMRSSRTFEGINRAPALLQTQCHSWAQNHNGGTRPLLVGVEARDTAYIERQVAEGNSSCAYHLYEDGLRQGDQND